MATATYADFFNNFTFHPVRGDLTRAVDVAAINQSLRNLVFTNKYERFYKPDLGGNVTQTLFENLDAHREEIIKSNIEETIRNYEKRVTNLEVTVVPSQDNNAYECTIVYTPRETVEPVKLDLILRRVR